MFYRKFKFKFREGDIKKIIALMLCPNKADFRIMDRKNILNFDVFSFFSIVKNRLIIIICKTENQVTLWPNYKSFSCHKINNALYHQSKYKIMKIYKVSERFCYFVLVIIIMYIIIYIYI